MEKQVIIITGANSGIGYEMTRALLEAGYRVAGLDLRVDRMADLRDRHAENFIPFQCDVTTGADIDRVIHDVTQRWEQVDILVNNAVLALFCAFEEKDIADYRREFEVNYFSSVELIRAVLPIMKVQKRGIIHNVGSGVSITGFPRLAGYTSTKGAIESLTRTLRLELEPYGIYVTLMHPPLTRTPSAADLGVPGQMMADPAVVGNALARQILSTKPVITTGFSAGLGLLLMRIFPAAMGGMLSRATEKARAGQSG